jgi:hypothetical protein
LEVVVAARISNYRKREENSKLGQKSVNKRKSSNSIDLVGVDLQLAVTYVYIGSMMQLFESDMTKSFLNK